MHLNDITKVCIPIINGFPHGKFSFEGDTPFMEAFSFDYEEITGFQAVNNITPTPKNLMSTNGYLYANGNEQYDVYAVYSYNDRVHFLTIVYDEVTYTYDFYSCIWVGWGN